jgi:16S rRNA (guanine(966)-N(2))-methyltransferase RsmD
MPRVVTGRFRGTILQAPEGDKTRPTTDKVKEALFSIIQSYVPDSEFLDLFAGSGAVGLEALSRGARSATFVERDRRHLAVLRENVGAAEKRGVPAGACSVVCADVYRYLAAHSGQGFDVAFADPPYALGEERGFADTLGVVAERGVVRPGGLFIAEAPSSLDASAVSGWELVRDRTYGRTRLCIWRRIG